MLRANYMPGTRQSGVVEGPQQTAAAFVGECAEIIGDGEG